jgi:hypothetical protein
MVNGSAHGFCGDFGCSFDVVLGEESMIKNKALSNKYFSKRL